MGRFVHPVATESRHGPELILGHLDAAWADCVVSVQPRPRFFVREPQQKARRSLRPYTHGATALVMEVHHGGFSERLYGRLQAAAKIGTVQKRPVRQSRRASQEKRSCPGRCG